MRLDGKVVVVTGAGRGIGRAIAINASQEGANVVLAARSTERLQQVAAEIEEVGGQAQVIPTDVRDLLSVRSLATEALSKWGQVDVLVNNSGIGGPSAPMWEVTKDQWEETMAVNVTGAYLCCQALLPSMIERRSGSIINVGSMTGKRPLMNRTAYAASKAALVGLTRTLAEEVGPYGLRVNVVSPGAVEGERIDWVFQQQAAAQNRDMCEVRSDFESQAPLRRLVTADDVARTVCFLASEDASGITGADLNVTAGLVMY